MNLVVLPLHFWSYLLSDADELESDIKANFVQVMQFFNSSHYLYLLMDIWLWILIWSVLHATWNHQSHLKQIVWFSAPAFRSLLVIIPCGKGQHYFHLEFENACHFAWYIVAKSLSTPWKSRTKPHKWRKTRELVYNHNHKLLPLDVARRVVKHDSKPHINNHIYAEA